MKLKTVFDLPWYAVFRFDQTILSFQHYINIQQLHVIALGIFAWRTYLLLLTEYALTRNAGVMIWKQSRLGMHFIISVRKIIVTWPIKKTRAIGIIARKNLCNRAKWDWNKKRFIPVPEIKKNIHKQIRTNMIVHYVDQFVILLGLNEHV